MELLVGILCGIVLSLLFGFGPAFFGLIQNSIQHGFRRASAFAVGVSLSDVAMVFLMLTVLKNVDMESALHNPYVAGIGGGGIILFGVYTFRKKVVATAGANGRMKFRAGCETRLRYLLAHGFLLNILNPFVWIYWISVVTLLSGEMDLNATERYVFFAGLLSASLGCDLLKCRLASLLQQWFTPRLLGMLNKVVGAVLVLFGLYLIGEMVAYRNSPALREKEQSATPQSTRIIQQLHSHMVKDSAKHGDTVYLK